MPNKKYYFILSPYHQNEDELRSKAASYYGERDYEPITKHPEFFSIINATIINSVDKDPLVNLSLMITGVNAIAMALCDSVYISKDWATDGCCKFCHALAFSHGLDMVYES